MFNLLMNISQACFIFKETLISLPVRFNNANLFIQRFHQNGEDFV